MLKLYIVSGVDFMDLEIIIKNLKENRCFNFDYSIGETTYNVKIVMPNDFENFNIPYILVIPKNTDISSCLVMEVNNCETDELEEILENSLFTAKKLAYDLNDSKAPILIPILPSKENEPYFQQLSKETFELSEEDMYYRIDLQVKQIIEKVKNELRFSIGVEINDKIFLSGYSSSGVFAQRFALIHPEIICGLCVGGASGSIPFPTADLKYPLGVKDFKNLGLENFDIDNYKKIIFRYYVGDLEDKRKSNSRFDEDGNFAPMHDMSYFDRSVPVEIGLELRKLFGKNLLVRSRNEIDLMKKMGFDIEQFTINGRTHNNINGIGVNELSGEIIKSAYEEILKQHNLKK